MIFRRMLLVLGTLAMVAGIVLTVLSLRQQPSTGVSIAPSGGAIAPSGGAIAPSGKTVQRQSVLTAARAVPVGTLLRGDDIKWSDLPVDEIPPRAIVHDPASEGAVLGAAARRAFQPGEPIVADQIIKPMESGFLPAVLGPGMRAISIAIEGADAGSGLIAPGDHVDVILTQNFPNRPGGLPSYRAVGEAVLRDLRVIAVDQTTNLTRPNPSDPRAALAPEVRVPKTVTLEVSAHQAEVLTVAQQLGKLQLALRSLTDVSTPEPSAPTWATEVSRALKYYEGEAIPGTPDQRTPAVPLVVDVIHGKGGEQLCFSRRTGHSVDCASIPPGTTPAPSSPAPSQSGATTPAAPTAPGVTGSASSTNDATSLVR